MVTRESAIAAIESNADFIILYNDILTKKQGTISFYMIDDVTLACKYQYTDDTELLVTRKKILTLTEKEYDDTAFANAIVYQFLVFLNCERDKYCSLIPTNSYVRGHELTNDIEKELDEQYMRELGRHVVIQKGSADYTPPESTDAFTMNSENLADEEAEKAMDDMFDDMIVEDRPEINTTNKLIRVLTDKMKEFKAAHPNSHINTTGLVMLKINELFNLLNEPTTTESYTDRKERKRQERKANKETKEFLDETVPFDPTCEKEECVIDALAVKEVAGDLEEYPKE